MLGNVDCNDERGWVQPKSKHTLVNNSQLNVQQEKQKVKEKNEDRTGVKDNKSAEVKWFNSHFSVTFTKVTAALYAFHTVLYYLVYL